MFIRFNMLSYVRGGFPATLIRVLISRVRKSGVSSIIMSNAWFWLK